MFSHDELSLIYWMLGTAVENNPDFKELIDLNQKVEDLLADALDRLGDPR